MTVTEEKNMTDKPCRGCEKRAVWHDENGVIHTCHQDCPKYRKAKAERETLKKQIRQENEAEIIAIENIPNMKKRRRKRRN